MRKSGQPKDSEAESVVLVGDSSKWSEAFREGIRARRQIWIQKANELGKVQNHHSGPESLSQSPVILLQGGFWYRLRFRSRVPKAMKSPQAREWTDEFRAILLLSEKKIPFLPSGQGK
jgi:hypothetical protein